MAKSVDNRMTKSIDNRSQKKKEKQWYTKHYKEN
jgi:hypothetical protein